MARSSLERRSRAACGHASRRTQQVIDQRCVRPASANDTTTTGTHVSFGDPLRGAPLRVRLPRMRGAFSRRPTRFGCFGSWFAAGVFFPWRRPSSHPLTLPSPHTACPLRFRERRPPCPWRGGACERAAKITFTRTSRERTHASDDPERLPSAGRRSRRRGCPRLRFASARSPVSRILRASTTMTPFVRFLPQRYDREHDPEKGRFLAAPADRAGARPGPTATNRREPPRNRHPLLKEEVATRENEGTLPDVPVLRAQSTLLPTGRRERAVLVTSPPSLRTASFVGTGREPRVEEFLALEESPYSLRLEHLLVTGCTPGSLESTPLR